MSCDACASSGGSCHKCPDCGVVRCNDCLLAHIGTFIEKLDMNATCPGDRCTRPLYIVDYIGPRLRDAISFVEKHLRSACEPVFVRIEEAIVRVKTKCADVLDQHQDLARLQAAIDLLDDGVTDLFPEVVNAYNRMHYRLGMTLTNVVSEQLSQVYDGPATFPLIHTITPTPDFRPIPTRSRDFWKETGNSFSICMMCRRGSCGPDDPARRTERSYRCTRCNSVVCSVCRTNNHAIDDVPCPQADSRFRTCPFLGCGRLSYRDWISPQVVCSFCGMLWNFETGYALDRGPWSFRIGEFWTGMAAGQRQVMLAAFKDMYKAAGYGEKGALDKDFIFLVSTLVEWLRMPDECQQASLRKLQYYMEQDLVTYFARNTEHKPFRARVLAELRIECVQYILPRLKAQLLAEFCTATEQLFSDMYTGQDFGTCIASWGVALDRLGANVELPDVKWPHRQT